MLLPKFLCFLAFLSYVQNPTTAQAYRYNL
nr:MAG TPA: hypothetical protein [Caudoviricetes sp.]